MLVNKKGQPPKSHHTKKLNHRYDGTAAAKVLAMKKSMLSYIETVTQEFRHCFSRRAAWGWFVVLIVGFMLRSDKLGITSVIRDLALAPQAYDALIHFFRAASWKLDELREYWYRIVRKLAPLHLEFPHVI